jgi:hypothetical protein
MHRGNLQLDLKAAQRLRFPPSQLDALTPHTQPSTTITIVIFYGIIYNILHYSLKTSTSTSHTMSGVCGGHTAEKEADASVRSIWAQTDFGDLVFEDPEIQSYTTQVS